MTTGKRVRMRTEELRRGKDHPDLLAAIRDKIARKLGVYRKTCTCDPARGMGCTDPGCR